MILGFFDLPVRFFFLSKSASIRSAASFFRFHYVRYMTVLRSGQWIHVCILL
jgi:hypothetical protein